MDLFSPTNLSRRRLVQKITKPKKRFTKIHLNIILYFFPNFFFIYKVQSIRWFFNRNGLCRIHQSLRTLLVYPRSLLVHDRNLHGRVQMRVQALPWPIPWSMSQLQREPSEERTGASSLSWKKQENYIEFFILQ